MKPKVSVIIPNYNSIQFIEETLHSVYNQTFKNIEIIVVDDGSTDGSFELISNVKHSNLKLVRNPRKGACAARNYGFELSSGDYIQYLDADDVLCPNKIAAQLNMAVDQNDDQNVIYSCKWMHFESNLENAVYRKQLIDQNYSKPYLWLNDSWMGNGMGQTSIWLTSKDLITKAGPWNENLAINQDGEFFSRVIFEADAIKFSQESIVYYRRGNTNSISQINKFAEAKAQSLLNSYVLYKQHAKKYNRTKELRKALGNNFLMFIYQYYNLYPHLIKTAEKEFYDLGFGKMWPVGGPNFKKISNVFGFKNMLNVRKLMKSISL